MSEQRSDAKMLDVDRCQGMKVERGMLLLAREPERNGIPERYKLWAVTSVRQGAKSASVTLIQGTPEFTAEAKATFPDGIVSGNWQVFTLSPRDLAHIWKARSEEDELAQTGFAEPLTGRDTDDPHA